MIKTYRVQWSVPYFTKLPTDVVTNSTHWSWNDPGAEPTQENGGFGPLRDLISQFYATVFAGAHGMAPWCDPHHTTMKVYDIADAPGSLPRFVETFDSLAASDGVGNLPPEIAVVVSLKAGLVQAPHMQPVRGRMYLGGIGGGFGTQGDATHFPVVYAGARTAITTAMQALLDTQVVTPWRLCVLSRKLGLAVPVIGGYVDDAFDIQRRRGQAPVARTVFGA